MVLKKTERGPLWDFSTTILSQNSEKIGDLLGIIFSGKKCPTTPKKTQRWDILVSPGIVCYAEKKENPF